MATPVQQDTTATAPRGSFAFIIPPPVTIWLQFDDGTQVGVTPTPQRVLSSMMGMPFVGGMPIMMMPGLFGNGGIGSFSDDGVARAIHELFMRSQQQPQGPPPTSKAFLDKIPLKTWTNQSKTTEKCTDCSICLCDYEDNDEVLPLPCGHQFHKDCGMKWLVEHNVCPTCRYALPTADATATKPEQTATTQPVAEPEAEPESARTTRVRPRSPHLTPERQVRRRISERDVFALPGAVETTTASQEDELDSMLEAEATRFVAEEQERSRMNDVNFDDIDIEDLLQDSSN